MRRALIAVTMWALASGSRAQTPPSTAPVSAAPDAGRGTAPHLQTAIETLAQDAVQYARLYAVPLAQALRELQAQEGSVPATDALRREFADRLAGLYLDHTDGLHVVVVLTGDEAVPSRSIATSTMLLPVSFRTGAPTGRAQLLAAIAAHQADLRAALRNPPGMGVDPRTGMLAVMVKAADVDAEGADVMAARLGSIAGVPVEVRRWSDANTDLAATGGGRVIGFDPQIGRRGVCTGGFVVTDGAQTGIATAAHCPDELSYIEPGGGEVPLTMIGAWGARYQDVQIHVGAGTLPPLFFADKAKTQLRTLATWHNRESTRAGDMVCHRGERTGYSCAEVEYVDFAPPGDLCAGPCTPTWVAVRGPDCRGGDSGGPVFVGNTAFGLVKGSSYTADGRCRLYYYMSTDYLPPTWTLLHGGNPPAITPASAGSEWRNAARAAASPSRPQSTRRDGPG